jgi:CBS domain-containing protein
MTERHSDRSPPTARDLMKEVRAVIPHGLSVGDAAVVLASADIEAAPVVDADGRCVGVFRAGDFRRWAAGPAGGGDVVSDWQIVPAPRAPDAVRFHMSRRYGAATPEATVPELLHRLQATPDPFLVVLDRQRRPRGLVFAIDLLRAESAARRAAVVSRPRAPAGEPGRLPIVVTAHPEE